jgi:hypothetical protein
MKNMLKKVLVLAIVATMFVMPASTVLAASNSYPVVIYDADDVTMIQFQPEPLFIPGGGSTSYFLYDYSNPTGAGVWNVPAGKTFAFQFIIGYNATASARIRIYKNDVLYSDRTATFSEGYSFTFAPESTNNRWNVMVTPYTDMNVEMYIGSTY